jgi:hypothetical protein
MAEKDFSIRPAALPLGQNRQKWTFASLSVARWVFFKSARSNVKIRQNPSGRIGQICQKFARNWDPFRLFFTARGSFLWVFSADLPLSQEWPGQNIVHSSLIFFL